MNWCLTLAFLGGVLGANLRSHLGVTPTISCGAQSSLIAGKCYQTTWTSGATTKAADLKPTSASLITRPAIVVTPNPAWVLMPGSQWVWDANTGVGSVAFVDYISLPLEFRQRLQKATLVLSVDNGCKVYVNDRLIEEVIGFTATRTIEIASFVSFSDTQANVLRFDVQNSGGPGGLIYKLDLKLNTCSDAVAMDNSSGICWCRANYYMLNNKCYQKLWTSGVQTLSADPTPVTSNLVTRPVKLVSQDPYWTKLAGADWVWDTIVGVGTAAFVEYVSLPTALQPRLMKVTLTLAVDNQLKLSVNDRYVSDVVGYGTLQTIDLTPYLVFSNTQANVLRFDATNTGGPAGLIYKVELSFNSCDPKSQDYFSGYCRCKANFVTLNSKCYQSVLVSNADTQSSIPAAAIEDLDLKPVKLVAQDPYWTKLSGADWVWDTSVGVGTATFVDTILLPMAIRTRLVKATLTLAVDNQLQLTVNGRYVKDVVGYSSVQTIDLAPYLVFSDTQANVLRFDATNTGGPAGLIYKLEIAYNLCDSFSQDYVNGVCWCKTNFVPVGERCYQNLWVSRPQTLTADTTPLSADLKTRAVQMVTPNGAWVLLPGAEWVWDANTGVGTVTFIDNVVLPTYIRQRITKATLTVAVDNSAKVLFNDHAVKDVVGFGASQIIDIAPFLEFSDVKPSILRFDVNNSGGPGGLLYKLELTLNPCNDPITMESVQGVCKCKSNYQALNDKCYQTVWVSDAQTVSANVKTLSADLQTRPVQMVIPNPAWASLPGALWVWDILAGELGTAAFVDQVLLPTVLRSHVTKAILTLAVDNTSKLYVNDRYIKDFTGFGALQTIDIVQYLAYSDTQPNILRIDATNQGGPGGLIFKLELTVNPCNDPSSMEPVQGVCKCKAYFVSLGGNDICYQNIWISSAKSVSADPTPLSANLQTRPVQLLVPNGAWAKLPGAEWVWDTKAGEYGTGAFVENVWLPTSLLGRVAKITLSLSVDNTVKIIVNDQVVAQNVADFLKIYYYDLTPYFNFSDTKANILRLDATNLGGPGGLAYKLEITFK